MALLLPNSIFFHCPKTGGTWLRHVINQTGIQWAEVNVPGNDETFIKGRHAAPDQVNSKFFEKRKSFTILRDPTEWLHSLYEHLKRDRWSSNWLISLKAGSFPEFIDKAIENYPKGLASHYFSRFEKVDVILRTENLFHDINSLLDNENVEFNPQLVKPINKARYNREIDDATLEKIKNYESDLIKRICQLD